jgi:hypothetical protein
MDIWVFNIGRRELFEILIQRPTRNVGERRLQGLSLNPVMAFSTQINLQVARKSRGIQNQRFLPFGRTVQFLANMVCSGAVAAFTRDARY